MAKFNKYKEYFSQALISNNPVFFQALGMCPTLGVTSTAINGFGMGMATATVLVASNFFISLIRKIVPAEVRIPSFIVVIATFVTIIQFILKAYVPSLDASLGLFIPLIVVNCLILARAESFASKNNPIDSLFDGLAMGLGFTFALTVLGAIRELLGSGTLFNMQVLPELFPNTIMMILPPGAFLTLGFILAFINYKRREK